MYGRYTQDLSDFARQEAKRLKAIDRKKRKEDYYSRKKSLKERSRVIRAISNCTEYVWSKTFARLGEDWVYLATLGVLMATISFIMDRGIGVCNQGKN